MPRRGRKRKIGTRVNGRLVQPSQAERERNVKLVVMEQPHRKDKQGADSQMRENAVGRLILDCWQEWWPDPKDQPQWSREDLYTASQKYADAWSKVQAVMSSGRPLANETRPGRDTEPTDDEIKAWRDRVIREWSDISNSVGGHGSARRKAADIVIIDNPGPEWSPPHWIRYQMMMALVNLATHCFAGKRRAA